MRNIFDQAADRIIRSIENAGNIIISKSQYEELQAYKWQPIETAPKDIWILLVHGSTDNTEKGHDFLGSERSRMVTGKWIDEDWVVAGYDSFCTIDYNKPTHWQPLPKPPIA